MATREEVQEALNHIDPCCLDYHEWLHVGMALKSEGMDCSMWDEWSRRNTDPLHGYKPGLCEQKWRGFTDGGVTISTVFGFAKQQSGWTTGGDEILGWDALIGDGESPVVLTTPDVRIPHNYEWVPSVQLRAYLKALFLPDELVSFCVESIKPADKWIPGTNQNTGKKVSVILDALNKHPEDITYAVCDYNPEAGAWIRINPVNGEVNSTGHVTDQSISAFRHVLVESDDLPIESQWRIMSNLQLPIAALVNSGGKSLHAVVKIDADDAHEYAERVKILYDVCNKNGLKVDSNNKNLSRLSRMPGVTRGEKRQELLATNIGKANWEEWAQFIDDPTDKLPPILDWYDVEENPPELEEEIIGGVLRKGHKLLVTAASKAGKSFLMIELAVRLAHGMDFLGFPMKKSRVLYANFEIADASFAHRVIDMKKALGITERNHNLSIWNLRGQAQTMEVFATKLIKRVIRDGHYDVIIIDPIYKVQTGDENSAEAISKFCNQLDRVCQDTKCSAIYVHHHSKGAQLGKKAIDRGSGSGVFGRDADALLDLTEIELTDAQREMMNAGERSAFVLSGDLREFKRFKDKCLWFDYPLHTIDESGQLVKCIRPEGTGETESTARGKQMSRQSKIADIAITIRKLWDEEDGWPRQADVIKYYEGEDGYSESTIKRLWADAYREACEVSRCQNPYIDI